MIIGYSLSSHNTHDLVIPVSLTLWACRTGFIGVSGGYDTTLKFRWPHGAVLGSLSSLLFCFIAHNFVLFHDISDHCFIWKALVISPYTLCVVSKYKVTKFIGKEYQLAYVNEHSRAFSCNIIWYFPHKSWSRAKMRVNTVNNGGVCVNRQLFATKCFMVIINHCCD